MGKARAGKPSTRAGFQKERSATAKQAPKRPNPQVKLVGEGITATQSAQTRKLRLWERVRQRYSSKLRGYATKPVRPIQTSYARLDGRMPVTATQSAQTRKLRLWERVQQRYSTKLSGYATKPVRPIQTSYARAVQPSKFNMHRVPKPTSYAYGMGYRQVSAQHGNKQCRAEQEESASIQGRLQPSRNETEPTDLLSLGSVVAQRGRATD